MAEKVKKEPSSKPFDLDLLLGKTKNRVSRMGVELEGGWDKRKFPAGVRLERDTSVFRGEEVPGYMVGELPLGPWQPGSLGKALKKYYPQKVDYTCGMHIHMSFVSMRHYGLLMIPEYQDSIIEYVSRWAKKEAFPTGHHIWTRLSGETRYCQKQFWPDEQIAFNKKDHDQDRHGHRYTMVNYCGRQKTIEVRLLPMMDTVEQAIRACNLVVDVTNACLAIQRRRERRVREKLELSMDEIYEDYMEIKL